jgi:hypothetical protein
MPLLAVIWQSFRIVDENAGHEVELVHVDHIEDVRELACHIGVVAPTFLEPEVNPVTARLTGQALHDLVGLGVKDRDGRTQKVRGDHILAVGLTGVWMGPSP